MPPLDITGVFGCALKTLGRNHNVFIPEMDSEAEMDSPARQEQIVQSQRSSVH